MTIQVGETLPADTLIECVEFDPDNGCPINPQTLNLQDLVKGKKIVIFGLPGAFTPTCSLKHMPGYVEHAAELKAKGVDEVWCIAVNDHFVMAAWGREQQAAGKVRMMADGSAAYVKSLGLDRDLTPNGMGIRSQRFAMIVNDGVVQYLGIEASGKFEVSNVEAVLAQL